MRWLLFINRVALVCNICYLSMFVLQNVKGLEKFNFVVSIITILALIAFLINFVTLFISIIAIVFRKKNIIPKYLLLLNVAFFLLQFYYFLAPKN